MRCRAPTLALVVAAATSALLAQEPAPAGDRAASAARLAAARDWLYQLQELDPDAVARTRFDVLVTDPTRDGTDATLWPAETVRRLQTGGRVCLAYVSIGEAEDYRGYWKAEWGRAPPAWLGPENPDWKGNYAVRYWDPAWQRIALADDGLLARAVERGWDGAYLDIVDAYEQWSERGELSRGAAMDRMAAFVRAIGAACRARRPGFLIVPQNGSDLVVRDDVLPHVDGLGLEDTFFLGERPRDPAESKAILACAARVRAAGKGVFEIDYCRDRTRIAQVYERARAAGLVPYTTVRALDRLTIDPGHEPE